MANSNIRLPEQNNAILVGRLTHDPEVRFTAKGQAVCRFNIAANRRYRDASGNWQDNTSFVPIVVWGDMANRCGERLKKGFPVHVEGRIQSRQWETKDGQKRNTLEIIARRVQFLSKVSSAATEGSPGPDSQGVEEAAGADDEEIPF
jgi:single-strand DNA-binding protein